MASSTILTLNKVVKSFGSFTALHGIDLEIKEGEFFTIVGPSGSGKTTLIRLLVGMEQPTDGEIWLRDQRIDKMPANERPTCMVFQSLALFPHRTVGQNIEFPLKIRGVAPAERKARALELLELLRLPSNYYKKRINECSGGERQRVALARALAFDPEILFFDEPLSALDYRLRKTLEKELKDLHARTGKTFVYITHSLEEAMVMSDRIAIMRAGHFEQISTTDEIYAKPQSRFVAEFMGEVNLFDLSADSTGALQGDGINVNINGKASDYDMALEQGAKGTLMVRPEFVRFLHNGEKSDFSVRGNLLSEYTLGSRIQYEVLAENGQKLTIEKLQQDRFDGAEKSDVLLGWDAGDAHMIKEN